jgi:hypothetical protein
VLFPAPEPVCVTTTTTTRNSLHRRTAKISGTTATAARAGTDRPGDDQELRASETDEDPQDEDGSESGDDEWCR